jgi:nucleoside-diphosphate-sugar epimerase
VIIGLIGAFGFIGATIKESLLRGGFSVIPIERGTSQPEVTFDVVINAGGNSKKYKAELDPYSDFSSQVMSLYAYVTTLKYKKWIQISSVDVEDKGTSHYGFNKHLIEEIANHFCTPGVTTLRCVSVVGKDMKKGLLFDILNGSEIRLTPQSRIGLVWVQDVADAVCKVISDDLYPMVYLLSSTDRVGPCEIATILKKPVRYSTDLVTQVYGLYYKLPEGLLARTAEEHIKKVLDERVV